MANGGRKRENNHEACAENTKADYDDYPLLQVHDNRDIPLRGIAAQFRELLSPKYCRDCRDSGRCVVFPDLIQGVCSSGNVYARCQV